jgi:hypothetical protein
MLGYKFHDGPPYKKMRVCPISAYPINSKLD